MKAKVKVKKVRDVRIDAELWHTSACLLRCGQNNPYGSQHQIRASLVFTAFALEAALNQIGPCLIRSWSGIEKSLSPIQKLALLCEVLDLQLNSGERPWQILVRLIQYRNWLAHGRPTTITKEYQASVEHYIEDFYEQPSTSWEQFETESNATIARHDVEHVVSMMHSKRPKILPSPFSFGLSSASAGV